MSQKVDQVTRGDIVYPDLFEAADKNANRFQRSFFFYLGCILVIIFTSGILSFLDVRKVWFAIIQLFFLLANLGLLMALAVRRPQISWYAARALAESVKTVTWRYMMRAKPFNKSDDAANKLLAKRLFEILEENKKISSELKQIITTHQYTDRMQQVREMPVVDRMQLYLRARIDEQRNWYRQKAIVNAKQARIFFLLIVLCFAVSIVFAVLKVAYIDIASAAFPSELFFTLSSVLLAWMQSKRFDELSASYTLAAHEINRLRMLIPNEVDEKLFSDFVGDAENAFSREHTQWRARRDVSEALNPGL
jgi:FtsH-binding integral membrane protein